MIVTLLAVIIFGGIKRIAKFAITNVGISTSKEIKITDTFSIPLKATAILNPKTEQFFLVAGITL